MTVPGVTGSSRVSLYPLEMRADRDQWFVGRMSTGTFVSLPPIAVEALALLGEGLTTDATADRLRQTRGRDLNIRGFVEKLMRLGYVSAVDGQPVSGPNLIRPTWPWIRPEHARWALSPATAFVVLIVPVLAMMALVARPDLIPSYHRLLWSDSTSLIVVGNAAIGWSVIVLHESAHLFTARGAGVPGRIGLGTQLQFLTVQTDVSGIWVAARRIRMTVYLSGMAVNLFIAGAAVLLGLVVGVDGGTGSRLLGATAALSLLFVPTQFLLFMRTDLYFLLQDLAHCGNLYADGSAYARYRAYRLWCRITGRARPLVDPSLRLPVRERRAVHAYAPFLVVGTVLCLGFAATVTVPAVATVLARALRKLGEAEPGRRLDGLLTLIITGGVWVLWCHVWWRRHRSRIAGWWNRYGSGKERR